MNALAIAAVAACMGWSVQSFGYAAMPLEFGGGGHLWWACFNSWPHQPKGEEIFSWQS